jgi:hypothetical protein
MHLKALPEYGYFSAVEFTSILNNNSLKEYMINFSPLNENTNHGIQCCFNESLPLQYKYEIDRLMNMCHYNQHPNKEYFEDFIINNSFNRSKGLKYFKQIMVQEKSSPFTRLNNVNKKVSNPTKLSYVVNHGNKHLAQSKINQNRIKKYPNNQLLSNKHLYRSVHDRMRQVYNGKFTGNTSVNLKYIPANETRNCAELETDILKQNTMEHIFTKSEKEIFHQFGPKHEIFF